VNGNKQQRIDRNNDIMKRKQQWILMATLLVALLSTGYEAVAQ
jgi:hypothetical protein